MTNAAPKITNPSRHVRRVIRKEAQGLPLTRHERRTKAYLKGEPRKAGPIGRVYAKAPSRYIPRAKRPPKKVAIGANLLSMSALAMILGMGPRGRGNR